MNLPPSVNGKLYGYLKVTIEEVIWWKNPSGRCSHKLSVKSQWWGSDRIIIFRPSDVFYSNCGSSHLHDRHSLAGNGSNCKKFEIRTNATLFERYLKLCERLIFLVTDDTSKEILGKAIVENLHKLLSDEVIFQSNYYPILNKFNNRIGDIRICFDCKVRRTSVKSEHCLPVPSKGDFDKVKSCKRYLCNISSNNVSRNGLKRNNKTVINNSTVSRGGCSLKNNKSVNKLNYSNCKIQCSSKKHGDNVKDSKLKNSVLYHGISDLTKDNSDTISSSVKNSDFFINDITDNLLRKCEKLKKAMVMSLIDDTQGSDDICFYDAYLLNDCKDVLTDFKVDEVFCTCLDGAYEKQKRGDGIPTENCVYSTSVDASNELNLSDYLPDELTGSLNFDVLDLKNVSANDARKRNVTKCDNRVQELPLSNEDCMGSSTSKNTSNHSESNANIGEPKTKSPLSFDDFNVPDRKCETLRSINCYRLTIERLLLNEHQASVVPL